MEILDLKFEISDESVRLMKFPVKTVQSQIIDKCIEFRNRVFEEITKGTKRNPENITIVKHSSWSYDYSQVFYDGIFQGHLYEDFINCSFRFEPQN